MIIMIKEKLYNNPSELKNILEEIGCTYIKEIVDSHGSKLFSYGRDIDSSGMGNRINIETLGYYSFSQSKAGDIISLVSEMKNISLGESIQWLANRLGVRREDIVQIPIKLPFGGFFKDFSKSNQVEDRPLLSYSMSRNDIFREYGVSKLLIDDGISAIVQEEFLIGWDYETNRITIPYLDEEGVLVGIQGRINKKTLEDDEKKYKYLPIIPFNKGGCLYGFYRNYKNILQEGYIIVVESEKSVMKACEYGYNNVVSIGCSNISERQAKLIKSLSCNVIVALDEGLELEHCVKQSQKCVIKNPFFRNEVHMLDMSGLKKKTCIFDLSQNIIEDSFKNRLIHIE